MDNIGEKIIWLTLGVVVASAVLPSGITALTAIDTGDTTVDNLLTVVAPIVVAAVFILLLVSHIRNRGKAH